MPLRIILFGFSLRLLVAIWNGFFGPSFGAEFDALTFHMDAVLYARNPTLDEFRIGWIYTYFLGLFYYLTAESLFLGSLLSCVAWLFSALIMVRCLRIFAVEGAVKNQVMLIYALLPTSIMNTAVTLREPYQMLFVNLAIYAILKIYLHKAGKHWVTLILAITGASVLHGALMAFGVLLFAGTLLLVTKRGEKEIHLFRFGFMMAVSALVLWYCFSLFGVIAYNLDDGLGPAIEAYQRNSLATDARTHYKTEVELSSLADLPLFVPIALLHYLFEPFPWRVSAAIDIVLVLENILRGWLIWKCWRSIGAASLPKRRMLLFIMFFYVLMESIWSLGAVNWGTSARHHLPALGLLLLAAYIASAKKLRLKNNSTKI
jgi:hypothetical protein